METLQMEIFESWVDVILNELLMININKCRWRVLRARDQQTNSRGDNAAMCPS